MLLVAACLVMCGMIDSLILMGKLLFCLPVRGEGHEVVNCSRTAVPWKPLSAIEVGFVA